MKCFGYVERHDRLKRISEARVEGEQSKGRMRCGWEATMEDVVGSMEVAGRCATDRGRFCEAIGEVML